MQLGGSLEIAKLVVAVPSSTWRYWAESLRRLNPKSWLYIGHEYVNSSAVDSVISGSVKANRLFELLFDEQRVRSLEIRLEGLDGGLEGNVLGRLIQVVRNTH